MNILLLLYEWKASITYNVIHSHKKNLYINNNKYFTIILCFIYLHCWVCYCFYLGTRCMFLSIKHLLRFRWEQRGFNSTRQRYFYLIENSYLREIPDTDTLKYFLRLGENDGTEMSGIENQFHFGQDFFSVKNGTVIKITTPQLNGAASPFYLLEDGLRREIKNKEMLLNLKSRAVVYHCTFHGCEIPIGEPIL